MAPTSSRHLEKGCARDPVLQVKRKRQRCPRTNDVTNARSNFSMKESRFFIRFDQTISDGFVRPVSAKSATRKQNWWPRGRGKDAAAMIVSLQGPLVCFQS
jgi:hypothetical protein